MSVLKLYNPEAYSDNLIKIHDRESGCCGTDSQICKYWIAGETINNVTAITIEVDGDPEVILFESPANNPKELRTQIAKALESAGYDPYYDDAWKSIITSDDYIAIIGDARPLSLTIDGDAVNFTEYCTIGRVCKLQGEFVYETDPGLLSLNGSAGTQIGTNAGFVAGNVAPVISALISALDTEGVNYWKIDVIENTVYGSYIYTIHSADDDITINGNELVSCGCYPDFIS